MRQREQHDLSDRARRELDALDRALAGEPVDAELDAVARLARDMRAERPEISEGFAAKLDERVEDGFPPEPGDSPGFGDRFRAWISGVKPMRVLAPAGAVATVVMIASVAVFQSGGGEDASAPTTAETTGLDAGGAAADGEGPQGGAEAEAPSVAAPEGDAATPGGAESFSLDQSTTEPAGDRAAPNQARKNERSAALTLSAEDEEFDDVTDGVISVTDAHNGFIASSETSSSGDTSRAEFELSIPTDQLSATLAELSDLAHVEARSEDSLDITAPTVNARQRLTDARAQVDGLLDQLADADSPAETDRIQARLDAARAEVAQAKAEVKRLAQRANYAEVRVTVRSDGGGDGDWGIDEAVDDIGDSLSTAGGIALVSAAILLPIGLVIALVAFAWRRSVRRGRERALDA